MDLNHEYLRNAWHEDLRYGAHWQRRYPENGADTCFDIFDTQGRWQRRQTWVRRRGRNTYQRKDIFFYGGGHEWQALSLFFVLSCMTCRVSLSFFVFLLVARLFCGMAWRGREWSLGRQPRLDFF